LVRFFPNDLELLLWDKGIYEEIEKEEDPEKKQKLIEKTGKDNRVRERVPKTSGEEEETDEEHKTYCTKCTCCSFEYGNTKCGGFKKQLQILQIPNLDLPIFPPPIGYSSVTLMLLENLRILMLSLNFMEF